ncbi:hypothetical protein CAP48_14375 [Advenella sp. S44]|nr:hypothetical protein CAP48_14375 [Advenella sp. S44]
MKPASASTASVIRSTLSGVHNPKPEARERPPMLQLTGVADVSIAGQTHTCMGQPVSYSEQLLIRRGPGRADDRRTNRDDSGPGLTVYPVLTGHCGVFGMEVA